MGGLQQQLEEGARAAGALRAVCPPGSEVPEASFGSLTRLVGVG